MVAVTRDVAVELSRSCSSDDATLSVLLYSLRRFLAREAVDDELYDDLEAVLGEYADPTCHEITAIAERFREATTKLVEIVPHLVTPYPVDEMRRLIYLSAEQPGPDHAHAHLRWLALAVLAVLDLMGDDAS